MHWRPTLLLIAVSACLAAATAQAQSPTTQPQPPSVQPYIDPRQFDCPWPQHDHYLQPWRAFLETRSGYDFLQGVGVVFTDSPNIPLATRLLAESGFKTFRMEMPFGDMQWDMTRPAAYDRHLAVLKQCKLLGIRPTILLNGHSGVPCPLQGGERKLLAAAKAGDRTVRLADVKDLKPHYSGLSNLTDYWAAEAIFTDIDTATGTCKLSKGLPKDLPADKPVLVSTLKYRPLYAVGTREYEESVDGWTKYVAAMIAMCRDAGLEHYDLEIWNELTFGSKWIDSAQYYDPNPSPPQTDPLQPGGRYWELARRTLDVARLNGPKDVRVIWGFSNMTFYHTSITALPAGMDGQSYHPYGTGTRQLEFHEQHKDNPATRHGPPPPIYDMRLPEGYAITLIQTECLLRHTIPAGRNRKPPVTPRFYHYMTEHGINPPECDVTDVNVAVRMKTKGLIRVYSMWLNKGLDALHWFAAGGPAMGFGILPENIGSLKTDAKFDDVATPPMKALRNLTRCFAGSVPLAKTTSLGVDIAELTPPRKIWEAGKDYPPLWERECFAVLPFQATATKFVIPVYVMTYDIVQEHPGSRYRVTIRNLPTGVDQASYYDPITDQTIQIKPTVKDGVLEVELPVVDYPRVLTIEPRTK